MHRIKTISIVMAILLVFSQFAMVPTKAEGELFKVQLLGKETSVADLTTYGVNIVEDYENFVICNIIPTNIPKIIENGYGVTPFEPFREIKLKDYTLAADENRILNVSPELPLELMIPNVMPDGATYFILQFDLPIKKAWTDEMTALGAKIQAHIPDGGVVIKAKPHVVSKFHSWERIVGGTPFHPGLKISSEIVPDENDLVKITVGLYPEEKISKIRGYLPGECFDGSIERDYGSVNLECKFSEINSIAWIQAVSSITQYFEPELFMDRSREIMGIEARTDDSAPSLEVRTEGVWDHNLRGQGKIVCVQDTGCDTGNLTTLNRDFGIPPRITAHFGYQSYPPGSIPAGPDPNQSKPWVDTHGHGTFTSAQVMGDGFNSPARQYAGVAPEASLIVQRGLGWLNPGLTDAYRYGARVHSNSWGSSIDTYTVECQYSDQFVWDNPDMVITISAANSGPGVSTLGTPSVMKNDMCVGAGGNNRPSSSLSVPYVGGTILFLASNAGFSSSPWQNRRVCITGNTPAEDEFRTCTQVLGGNRIRIDSALAFNHNVGNRVHQIHAESMARFSSRGPTPDNRIKPDIVGPGRNVMSVRRWSTTYQQMSGTSMSCPNVAGCSVLTQQWLEEVEERGESSASLVKALLLNGTRDIREDWDGTPLFTPDYIGGWGYVDLYDTLYPTAPTRRDYSDYKPGIVTGQRVDFPIMAGPGTFKVNVVWSDYPSIPGALAHLVNDLDLIVQSPSGDIYRGNQYIGGIGASSESELNAAGVDTINNVEGVTLNNALDTGMYIVSVEGTNVPQAPQPFSVSIEYEAVVPDFDIRVKPDLKYVDSDWRTDPFAIELEPIAGFSDDVELTCSLIEPGLTEEFNPETVFVSGTIKNSVMTLTTPVQLDVGTHYIIVRGTSGNLYHEDILTIKVLPNENYRFDFAKDVGKGGIGNPHGDNGVMVYPDEKLGYSLQYDTSDMEIFSKMTVEDAIPRGAFYNGKSFPIPTHYSPDNGLTWINDMIPDKVGYGYRMRWDLHDIPGSGHLTKLSTGIPGYDNISDDIESSINEVMEFDSNGYPHVVWSNHILGSFPSDDEIYYRRWNGIEWVDLNGNVGFSNISNTVATTSLNPDMFLDDSDYPHFIWKEDIVGNGSVQYTHWDGSNLVKLDGTAGADDLSPTAPPGPAISYYSPRLTQGINGDIVVIYTYYYRIWWWSYYGIYLTRASGGIWTQLDSVTPGAQQFLHGSNWVASPTLEVDSNGVPYVALERRVWWFWWMTEDHMDAGRWDNATSSWVHFDGVTPGWEGMVPFNAPVRSHSDAELFMQTGDIPHLTWMDDYLGAEDIFYTRFEGGQWVMANGLPGYDQVTNTPFSESNPHVCLDPIGRPAIVWQEQDATNNIRFSWYRAGWRDLFGTAGSENITSYSSESKTPNVQIRTDGIPYFAFVDDRTGDDDVYVTYPRMDFESADFPGEIIWEAQINPTVSSDLPAIVNNAYISGIYDVGTTYFQTVKTKATTSNPLKVAIDVSKVATQSHVKIGQKIEYIITVKNTGSIPLTGIIVRDVMPRGMEVISSRPIAKKAVNGVSWNINRIAAGSSVILKVWAKVTDDRLQGDVVQNRVTVTAGNADVTAEDYSSVIVSNNTTGFPPPEVTFKVVSSATKSGDDVEFNLHVWSGNGPFSFEVKWGDGDTTSGNAELDISKKLHHTYNSSGEYSIECFVSDRFGVTRLIEYKVKIN
jgi:uncharacterized repeat protein (TIGR01451 family)